MDKCNNLIRQTQQLLWTKLTYLTNYSDKFNNYSDEFGVHTYLMTHSHVYNNTFTQLHKPTISHLLLQALGLPGSELSLVLIARMEVQR